MANKYPEVKLVYSVVNKAMREGIREITSDQKSLNNSFKLTKEQMKHNSTESEKYEAELSKLNKELALATDKTNMTASALENTKEITGENSKETKTWTESLVSAQKQEEYLKNKIHETTLKLEEATKKESEATRESEKRLSKLKDLETQQDSLKSSSERLNKEYELQVAQLGNNAKESDKAKLKQENLAKQLKNSADQVQNLENQLKVSKQEFGKNSVEVNKLENELLDAKVAAQEFANEYADSTNKMKNWGSKLGTYGSQLQDVGKKLTVGVSLPLIAAGGASIKMASDFESAAAGMRKTNDELVDKNGKVIISYKDLENGIRQMSKEIPASATEIAGVAEAAGQLGIKTENVLSFSRTMIDMGQATNLSSEEAATALARLANITGMSQNDFDRLGSSIVQLGNSFATTEAEITNMGLRLSGVGKQIGMSEADIMGLAAAMSSVGIEAESGGSAMTQGLKKMQNAVSLGTDELYSFARVAGMTGEEFQKAFNDDPVRALQAYVEGLSKASESGENLNMILAEVEISGLREADAFLRLAGNSELLGKAIDSSNQGWNENKALLEEVEKRYETFESKLQILKNQVIDIGIEFGGPLMDALSVVLDALQPVLKTVGDLATKFSEASPNTQKMIIALGTIAIALGPVVGILGTVISLIGGLMTAFGVGAAAAAGIVAIVPIAIAAVGALVAAIVIYWDEIVAYSKKLGESIKQIFSELGKWFKEKGAALSAWWSKFIDGFKTKVSEIGTAIKKDFDQVINWFKELFAKTNENVTGFKDKVVGKFNEIILGIKTWGENLIQTVVGFFTRLGEFAMVPISLIITLFEGLFLFIKAGFEIVGAAISAAFDVIAQVIEEKVKPPIEAVINFFVEKWNILKEFLITHSQAFLAFLVELGEKIKVTIITPITEAVTSVINKIIEMKNGVVQYFSELITSIVEKMIQIKDSVVTKFNETKNEAYKVVSNIVDGIVERFDKTVSKVKKIFTDVKDAALGPINDMKDGIGKAIDSIVDFFYNIKLPKFSLKTTTKSFFGKEISYPSGIDVKWNAKGAIFTKPTIFGSNNGILQGAGEAGREAALPLNKKTLGGIGEGIMKATNGMQQMMQSYVGNYNIRNQIQVEVVSVMDGKSVGYGAAHYVDDKFESDGKNQMYGIGRRGR